MARFFRSLPVFHRHSRRRFQPFERHRIRPPAGVVTSTGGGGGAGGELPAVPPVVPPDPGSGVIGAVPPTTLPGPGDVGSGLPEPMVGVFVDQFDRSDRDLSGDAGWKVMGSSGVGGSIIEIKDQSVQNKVQLESVAFQTLTVPGTGEQEASFWATATQEGNDSYIDLIINGTWAETYEGRAAGVVLRFYWLPNHERKIEIWQELPSSEDYEALLLGWKQLVPQGGPVNADFHGRLIGDGALNELQHIRMIVRLGDFGLIAAAYVNQEDDDHPTLEVNLRIGLVPAIGFAGNWGFGFGVATANSLIITEFRGTDYTLETAKATVMLSSQPTVLELREIIKRNYSGGSGSDLDDFHVDQLVAEQLEQIIHSLGEMAWFLERQEELTLAADANGYVTMPSYIERVYDIERVGSQQPSRWVYSHHSATGDVVIRMRTGAETTDTTHMVQFRQRWERSDRPNDVCVIPRQHMYVVVWGVCLTLASTRDRKPGLAESFGGLYQSRVKSLEAEAMRHWNQKRIRLQPRRRALSRPYQMPGPRY